jgi:hypothetical protein
MNILNFLSRLTGRPPLLPNGYPDMAANHRYVDNDGEIIQDVTRRINGGGFYNPPPPPPIPMYSTPKGEPLPPMVSKIVNKIISEPVRTTPSTTSSLIQERLFGTTLTDITSTLTAPKDPYVLDHKPLKRMLMKLVPWILDVTEVRVRKFFGTGGHAQEVDGIMTGPLEIHITVSPIHHSELMNQKIEVEVREKLFEHLLPLAKCMFPNHLYMNPTIIFSPSHSETILEYVK